MYKYKDIVSNTYWSCLGRRNIQYRFRFDPVPGISNYNSLGKYFKKPRITQERRKSFEYPELIRPKRRATLLPDPWDDVHIDRPKRSWKRTKKKKQYM
jgi:hypothetical protein